MDKLNKLYLKWLDEENKGHYKTNASKLDVLSLFGNQDFILDEIEKVFNFYNKALDGNILDVGCSMGGVLYSLYNSNKFDFIAGIDIDETAIEMATEYKKIKNIKDDHLSIINSGIYNIPFKENTFDFILMKDVGEHLENKNNLELAILELMRVLKKDGSIFIETPNYLFPFEVHLKIPMLPFISTKSSTKLTAKILNKNGNFVNHLNFTTPKMFESIFKDNNIVFKNAYTDYKLPYIIKNHNTLSNRFKFVAPIFKISNKLKLDTIIVKILKVTKLYPSLWYIVSKKYE